MVKYITKIGLLVFFVMPMLLIPSAVYADDSGLNVNIGIFGDNPDVGVDIFGNNPDVWINGQGLGDLAAGMGYQAGAAAGSRAAQNSAPNGQYSNSSTGWLPPLSSNGIVAAVAPDGKYDNWLVGWKGYFSPESNLDPSVYHGAGCGGTWGVCDGYPDMWCRRQIAGLAPEFVAQKEKLNTTINALAKVIMSLETHDSSLGGLSSDLRDQLWELEDMSLTLSVLEQEHVALEATVQQQAADFNRKLTIIISAAAFVLMCLIAAVVYLTVYMRKLRSQLS